MLPSLANGIIPDESDTVFKTRNQGLSKPSNGITEAKTMTTEENDLESVSLRGRKLQVSTPEDPPLTFLFCR